MNATIFEYCFLTKQQDYWFCNEVVFFRNQNITPEQQVAFTRRFGILEQHVRKESRLPGHPEILEIIKEPTDRINFGGGWHSDMSFLETPAIGSILYAVELPDWGGDTLFANLIAAYEGLSPKIQRLIEAGIDPTQARQFAGPLALAHLSDLFLRASQLDGAAEAARVF